MLKKKSGLFILLLLLTISACKQTPVIPDPTSIPPVPTDMYFPTAVILPSTVPETAVATATATPISTSTPPDTPESTPTPSPMATTPSTPTPPDTPVPTHTPSPITTTPPAPAILSFSADVEIADPGDTIQFSWDTVNSDWITLYQIVDYRLSTSWVVTASGVMSYTIGENERNSTTFMLFTGQEGVEESAQATVTVPLACPDLWFFSPAPNECPYHAPLNSEGAEQTFEHGTMVWVKEIDRIYVLFSDSTYTTRWNAYTDVWEDGDPVNDPDIEAPSGFYQPVRGFGLIWREEPNIRDRLGWATSPEMQFTTAYQTTARSKYNEFYLRALDGNVWKLGPEGGGWEKIIVAE